MSFDNFNFSDDDLKAAESAVANPYLADPAKGLGLVTRLIAHPPPAVTRQQQQHLAQLHQLRGRVGRSHHQAYAYLLTPNKKALTVDAEKRLEAIQRAGELGAGFALASEDLEIRGAGELLGEEQSGNLHAVGFTLYMEMLERAVKSNKPFVIDVAMKNNPVPTTGHWNILDIYSPEGGVSHVSTD